MDATITDADLRHARQTRHTLGLVLFETAAFRRKLVRATASVAAALSMAKRPYVAFSGGVDSMAVLGIVLRLCPDAVAAWSDDELEYPETVEMMTRLSSSGDASFVVTLGWAEHAGWFRPWRDAPPFRDPLPGSVRVGMPQDDWMARQGYDLTLLGTRADESRKRRDWLIQHGMHGGLYQVTTGTKLRCCPCWDWTKDDVFALLAGWGLPVNGVYDRLEALGIARERQRVGPLPLTPRAHLAAGWPELLARLEARYGGRWHEAQRCAGIRAADGTRVPFTAGDDGPF